MTADEQYPQGWVASGRRKRKDNRMKLEALFWMIQYGIDLMMLGILAGILLKEVAKYRPDRSVAIALDDGRAVAVDSSGHVTVWDADGEVEKEIDV